MDLLNSLRLGGQLSVSRNKFGLIIGLVPAVDNLLQLIAYLSLSGPVNVLDAGNHFNLIEVAYSIRRARADLYQSSERIKVVRAFTCVEVLHALQEQKEGAPLVIIDLLATFYDDAVSDQRAVLLVRQSLAEIARLKERAPVLASVRDDQPKESPRASLPRIVEAGADLVERTNLVTQPSELRLF